MKKPKIEVKGVFVPEIKGMNAGQVCSAYEGMIDALVEAHIELDTLADNGCIIDWKLVTKIEQALKKAGVE